MKVIIPGDLCSVLFILEWSKAPYTENKGSYIKHANTVQIQVNKVF